MRLLSIIVFTVVLISNTFGQTTPTTQVKTIADLVALRIPTINNRLSALVTGRVTENDGGGGLFFYDGASVVSTNFGTVFKPAASAGRWVRQYSGALNVKWFGAVGDGLTDETTAFTNALSVASITLGIGNGAVEVPAGQYLLESITFPSGGLTLSGVSPAFSYDVQYPEIPAKLIARSAMTTLITIPGDASTPSTQAGKIQNIIVEGNGLAQFGIHIKQMVQVYNVRVQNCLSSGLLGETLNSALIEKCAFLANYDGITITNGVDSSTRWALKDSIIRQNTGTGLKIHEAVNALVSNCVIESNTGNGVWIYKYTGEQITQLTFDTCYLENNGASATDDTRYQLLIDSQTKDFSNGPSTYLNFNFCYFAQQNATQRAMMVRSVIWCSFLDPGIAGGTQADNIQLDTWATAVVFKDRNGGPVTLGSGNRSFEYVSDRSGDGGFDFLDGAGTVHLKASRIIGTNYVNTPMLTNAISGAITLDDGDITLDVVAGNNVKIPLSGAGAFDISSGVLNVSLSGTTINELGADSDFRIKSDNNANMFLMDGQLLGRIAIGTTVSDTAYIKIGGAWTPDYSGGTQKGLEMTTSVTGAANGNIHVADFGGILVESASGTHSLLSALSVSAPTITAGAAAVTDASTFYVNAPTAATVTGANYALFVDSGNSRFDGDVILNTAGSGLQIKEGSNARMGVATLVGGTIAVANTSVTANTRIFISRSTTGGTVGHLSTTQIAATSFTVNSSDVGDTSTVNWLLIEPAP